MSKMITQIELQTLLGDAIRAVMDDNRNGIGRERALENADAVSKLAKQSNNVAKMTLLGDKMANRHDRTDAMIGEFDA